MLQFNLDTRVAFGLAACASPADYVQAQRVRARAAVHFERIFETVDVLVTPATATTAPVLDDATAASGMINLPLTAMLMRFMQPANFLGLPAVVLPVGREAGSSQLPIGYSLLDAMAILV
eukprot:jgi/Chrzof1/13622/Cz08g04150.t1